MASSSHSLHWQGAMSMVVGRFHVPLPTSRCHTLTKHTGAKSASAKAEFANQMSPFWAFFGALILSQAHPAWRLLFGLDRSDSTWRVLAVQLDISVRNTNSQMHVRNKERARASFLLSLAKPFHQIVLRVFTKWTGIHTLKSPSTKTRHFTQESVRVC